MKVLALETSGSNCSVALLDENKVIADFNCNTGTTHSQNLMPMVDNVLKFAETDLSDVDVLACSIGPGSFTGLRIGIASIKGMGISLNKKVIGVPSLLGLAYNIPHFCHVICSVLDAKNDNVYAAMYKYVDGIPTQIGDYISDSVDVLIDELKKQNSKIFFVGDGAISYKDKFVEAFDDKSIFMPYYLNEQTAVSIAKAALDKATKNEYDDYNSIKPLYLKKSQAERLRDDQWK